MSRSKDPWSVAYGYALARQEASDRLIGRPRQDHRAVAFADQYDPEDNLFAAWSAYVRRS